MSAQTAMKPHTFYWRLTILGLLFILTAGFLTLELLNVQATQGQALREQSERKVVRTQTVKASRGEIYDRYGRPLVVNSMSFSLQLDYLSWDKKQQNDVILRVCALLAEYGRAYTDTLPISAPPYAYTYAPDSESADRTRMESFFKTQGWPQTLSASGAMERLREKYGIPESLDDAQARMLAGIRYDMDRRQFSAANPFTILRDAGIELVTIVAEQGALYPGVVSTVEAVREYATDYAAHILGHVGQIYREEYDTYKEMGYPMNAIVGRDGMEKALESYLRGVDGEQVIETNLSGKTTAILQSTPAQAGQNAYLTIDLTLQEAAERALESHIERMRAEGGVGADAAGGAAVVIDVHTGEVLALASFPTFSLASFNADYTRLAQDEARPMFNRAIAGAYPPGSVFKMLTATAALEEGIITPDTVIRDEGVYRYFAPTYTPACWLYNTQHRTHGDLNVSGALEHSCNYFFYETGRLLGISLLNKYTQAFGLGQLSGIELAGESAGVMAGPDRRRDQDRQWYGGDTIQAAIGQSDNLFTPLQLANYIATIVNGGTRYEPHLLKTVTATDGNIVADKTPAVLSVIDYQPENLQAVLDGMRRVTEDGTASHVFSDYPIEVGGKTGSAQLGKGNANGVFVLAAPFDNPEIAIAVVVEHGGSGNNVAWIARDILTAYFAGKQSLEGLTDSGTLLR